MSVRWSNVFGQLVVACCSFFLLIQLRLSRLSWCSIAEVVREEVSQFLRRWPKLSRWSRTSSLVVGDEESQHGDTIEALVRCAAEYRHPVLDAFLEDATIVQKSIANSRSFLCRVNLVTWRRDSRSHRRREVFETHDVRQWAMTYGTFCPHRDRSLVYRLVGRSVPLRDVLANLRARRHAKNAPGTQVDAQRGGVATRARHAQACEWRPVGFHACTSIAQRRN